MRRAVVASGSPSPTPNLLILAHMLREHCDALEADFQRFYGLDLCDLWRGQITPRKAAVLAVQLPPGAQVWRSMGSDLAWTDEAHLGALNADINQIGNWQRGGGKKADLPKPIRRPSEQARLDARAERELARAEAFAQRQRERKSLEDGTIEH